MKKMMLYGIIGLSAGFILSACGGGGGGGGSATVYSKAEVKAYLFCAMSSNSKVISVESTVKVPVGLEVAYRTPASGDSPTVYNLKSDFISAQLFINDGYIDGSFDTSNRSFKYTLLLNSSTSSDILSNTIGKGLEIATFTLPYTTVGIIPTTQFPDSDIFPIIGKERNGNRDYLTGCSVNYVTTYK